MATSRTYRPIPTPLPDTFIRVTEASNSLGVSDRTVYRMLQADNCPRYADSSNSRLVFVEAHDVVNAAARRGWKPKKVVGYEKAFQILQTAFAAMSSGSPTGDQFESPGTQEIPNQPTKVQFQTQAISEYGDSFGSLEPKLLSLGTLMSTAVPNATHFDAIRVIECHVAQELSEHARSRIRIATEYHFALPPQFYIELGLTCRSTFFKDKADDLVKATIVNGHASVTPQEFAAYLLRLQRRSACGNGKN